MTWLRNFFISLVRAKHISDHQPVNCWIQMKSNANNKPMINPLKTLRDHRCFATVMLSGSLSIRVLTYSWSSSHSSHLSPRSFESPTSVTLAIQYSKTNMDPEDPDQTQNSLKPCNYPSFGPPIVARSCEKAVNSEHQA